MGFVEDIINFLVAPIRSVCPTSSCIPISTIIVITLALLVSVLSSAVNRRFVNFDFVTSSRRDYMIWIRSVQEARKAGDEELLSELLKQQAAMMKMSFKANLEQTKTTAITLIPTLLVYGVLLAAFPLNVAVAYSPIYLPWAAITFDLFKAGVAFISLIYWYVIAGVAIGLPLSRLFGRPFGLPAW